MALAAGQILQGRYRIQSLLGQGGMGAVYRAWDERLDIPVAIKEMTPQPGLDAHTLAQLRQQFRREAQVLARLHHPHLVRVGDFFEEGGNAYLVMDFVEGEDLASLIERQGALPESQVLPWAAQLLDALAYCHEQGVIHRDIKPQNVIIRPDGQAVLVDFGLVKLWDPNDPRTRTAMRGMGTPEYAPPEQYEVEAGHTDSRSDIYGLGATLYHALAGQAPPTATLRMADPERFPHLAQAAPQVSKRTAAAVMRALELARSRRWQSAREMAKALGISRPLFVLSPEQEAPPPPPPPPDYGGETRVLPGATPPATETEVAAAPEPPPPPVERRRDWNKAVPWIITTVVVLAALVATAFIFVRRTRVSRWRATLTATAAATASPTRKAVTPTNTPVLVVVTVTREPSATPTRRPTATFTPILPTRTPLPTDTPSPQAVAPMLLAPVGGGTYGNPITFQWIGTLATGQVYQVMAYHPESGYTVRSGLLTAATWETILPTDRYGEWRWQVSVIQDRAPVATSEEWMFWFQPMGGGGGGGGEHPTATPAVHPTVHPTQVPVPTTVPEDLLAKE